MSEKTKISWTDSTINFWSGCTMVQILGGLKESGCLHCYAKERDDRQLQEKKSHWGKGAQRLKSKGAVKDAISFNRRPWICNFCGSAQSYEMLGNCDNPKCHGTAESIMDSKHRRRIFSLSLGDWLDEEVPIEWLAEMLHTIYRCGDCVWILCTKRPGNFFKLLRDILDCQSATGSLPYDVGFFNWLSQWVNDGQPPMHITLLISVENQAAADLRIPQLLKIPAACRGLSLEPLLGDVKINPTDLYAFNGSQPKPRISWFIIGCESGYNRRDCNLRWVESLVEQGRAAGVATFVKQIQDSDGIVCKDIAEFPEHLQIQQWPEGF